MHLLKSILESKVVALAEVLKQVISIMRVLDPRPRGRNIASGDPARINTLRLLICSASNETQSNTSHRGRGAKGESESQSKL